MRPPRWAEALVSALLPAHPSARFIVGDLREEFERRPSTIAYVRHGVAVAIRLRLGALAARLRPGGGRPANTGTGGEVMGTLWQDVRIGIRGFLARPALTLAMVLTLGVAVGATTSIVSAVEGVLLDPLPFDDPAELIVVEVNTGGVGWYGLSAPEYLDAREQLTQLTSIGGFVAGPVTLGDSLQPRRIQVARVSADVLPLLGVAPALGRHFTAEEDVPGAANTIVLGHRLGSELFGDEEPVGRTVRLAGSAYTVVGVMPEGFAFPSDAEEAWVPLGLDAADPPPRSNHYLTVVGRLRPGATRESATAELARYEATTRERYPGNYATRGFEARLSGMHEWVVGPTRLPLLVLLGTVGLVLAIACVNVSLLLLSRAEARRSELAVRAAMGASRGRLVRQLLAETGVLAGAGGALGVGLAVLGVEALVRLAPPGTPRLDNISLDATVLVAAAGITILAGLLAGMAPALRGGRDGAGSVPLGARGVSAGRGRGSMRTRRLLLGAQVALATTLSVGAGLMMRTVGNLRDADIGFRPDGILTMAVVPGFNDYVTPEERVQLYDGILARVRALPGVEGAAATCVVPMTYYCGYLSLILEGGEGTPIGDAPDGVREIVTSGYFDVLGLTLVEGRLLGPDDRADAPPVAVVNETFAREMWPQGRPIGRRFRMWSEGWPYIEVVGVVGDVRNVGPDRPADPTFYVPHAQASVSAYATPVTMMLAIDTRGDPMAMAPAVRQIVRDTDGSIPVVQVRPMGAVVADTLALRRFMLRLLEAFGLVAVLLAGVGVYGVVSVMVGERSVELGLRKALGAEPAALVRQVFGEGMATTALGAVAGLAGGIALARAMAGLLYEVSAVDAPTLAAVFTLLMGTTAAASLLPAWRASRVHPMAAFREEG